MTFDKKTPLIPLIVAIDQTTKFFAVRFEVQTVCNRGFAFGIAPGFLNGLVAVFVLGIIFYLLRYEKRKEFLVGYYLILGGGFSNLIDRVIRGCVLDFVDFGWWPSFNVADATITFGVFILIYSILKQQIVRR